ncbi:MAG TPA: Crp/Fnr family transcriptional regulator [Pyrinomonadaceae bacterium]|jgi:CRP-like cAMP-binding protein
MPLQEVDPKMNRLLACLPENELQSLLPHFESVSLAHGDHVIVPGVPIQYMYFPLNALLSLVTTMEDGSSVESGVVGREGVTGIPVLLNAEQTTMPTFTQVPGVALRVKSAVMKEAYDRRGALHTLLNRYMHTVVVMGSYSTACNALHKIEPRMAKWLLMSSNGVGLNAFNLTHEFLAVMLGVRRASVSEIASTLRRDGLIDYTRGHIKILDRRGLEAASCECYGKYKDEYERLFSG